MPSRVSSSLVASLCTVATTVVLLSGILAPCLSSPILARTRQLLDFQPGAILQQQAQKAQGRVQQGAQKLQDAVQQQAHKTQTAVQQQTQKAAAALSHTADGVTKAAADAQQKRQANRAHTVEAVQERLQDSLGQVASNLNGLLPSANRGRLMLRRTLSSLADLKSYFGDWLGAGQGQAPTTSGAPAVSAQNADQDSSDGAPPPPPGAVPVDQVGLAAAGGDSGSSDGGIQVVTSNPIALSNPIDLHGGNYNGDAAW